MGGHWAQGEADVERDPKTPELFEPLLETLPSMCGSSLLDLLTRAPFDMHSGPRIQTATGFLQLRANPHPSLIQSQGFP